MLEASPVRPFGTLPIPEDEEHNLAVGSVQRIERLLSEVRPDRPASTATTQRSGMRIRLCSVVACVEMVGYLARVERLLSEVAFRLIRCRIQGFLVHKKMPIPLGPP